MSHVTASPAALVGSSSDIRRTAIIAGVLGLLAAALVIAAFALGGSSADTTGSLLSDQPAARTDGGPNEGAVAASVGSRQSAGPSESAIAAAVGTSAPSASAIRDESRIAAAIAGR